MQPTSIDIATIAVAPSTPSPRDRPPRSAATAASAAPKPARSTLVSGSVIARKPAATPSATQERPEDRSPAARAAIAAAATSTATLKPLIASTWLMPASRKSRACGARPGRRVPTVMAATNARSPSVAHPGMDRASAACTAARSATMRSPGHPSSHGRTSVADGTSTVTVGSRARVPGLARATPASAQPRTMTTEPRPGSGARPATRTSAVPCMGSARPPVPDAVTSRMNVCDASRGANGDMASTPASADRGAESTVPRSSTGPGAT